VRGVFESGGLLKEIKSDELNQPAENVSLFLLAENE